MPVEIPASHKDLLEGPIVVTLATLMPDGQPQLTAIWCIYDGEFILFSTLRERQKARNLQANPKATIMALDPKNPSRYLEVRAVAEITQQGNIDLLNQLARLYANKPVFFGGLASAEAEAEGIKTRLTCKLRPTKVVTRG